MARKVIGFDVTGTPENYQNAGSVDKAATGGSSAKGNYNQPGGMVNKYNPMKAAKGYIDADGSMGENTPSAEMGGAPSKGRGYSK